jgi:hypothetical protein
VQASARAPRPSVITSTVCSTGLTIEAFRGYLETIKLAVVGNQLSDLL